MDELLYVWLDGGSVEPTAPLGPTPYMSFSINDPPAHVLGRLMTHFPVDVASRLVADMTALWDLQTAPEHEWIAL